MVEVTMYGKDGSRFTVSGQDSAEVLERARIVWDTFDPAGIAGSFWLSARP